MSLYLFPGHKEKKDLEFSLMMDFAVQVTWFLWEYFESRGKYQISKIIWL